MVFTGLYGFFGNVVTVIVWRNELESHVGGFDIVSVEGRDFVVEDLVFWDNVLILHASKCASTGQNYFPLRFFKIGSTQVELLSMLWRSI